MGTKNTQREQTGTDREHLKMSLSLLLLLFGQIAIVLLAGNLIVE